MTVHPPDVSLDGGRVRIAVPIEPDTVSVRRFMPDQLWFELPEEFAPFVTDRLDGPAAAVLLLASSISEDIEVRGSISQRLAYGIEEYARVFHRWFPGRFHPIRVTSTTTSTPVPDPIAAAPPQGVTTAFSGGVDSTYTLWSHLDGRERFADYRVTHGLFVDGFDIPLEDAHTFRAAETAYDRLFRSLGLRLVPIRTNARALAPGIAWELAHGAALMSAALVLGGLHHRFFVPASTTYDDTGHWGTDPIIDHLLSTETLDVVHDGAHAHRVKKIAAIADWEPSHDTLRVCWQKPDGLQNCCRCYNCIVTLCGLEAAGALGRYTTFPLPLRVEDVRAVEIPSVWRNEVDAIVARLRERGRRDLAAALHDAVVAEPGTESVGGRRKSGPEGALFRALSTVRGLLTSSTSR